MSNRKRTLNIALTALFVGSLALFILTFCIGVPIYCRFFYYVQINTLDLVSRTGYDYDSIREAYDQVIRYVTLPGGKLGTRVFYYNESVPHFDACKRLVTINLVCMIISGAASLALVLLDKFKVISLCRPFGRHAYLLSAIIAVALPVLIGAPMLFIGFHRVFVFLHPILFPGVTDYELDPRRDPIISVMPEEFFLNGAIIIGSFVLAFAAALAIADFITTRRAATAAAPGGVTDGEEKRQTERKD